MRLASAALMFVLCAPIGVAQDGAANKDFTAEQSQSIERAFKWLRNAQNAHGTWGCEKSGAPSTAITSLSMLAFAAAGSTPSRGVDRERLERALTRLLEIQRNDGSITQADSTGMGLLYDHSCATLALAEFYGMQAPGEQIEGLGEGLKKAVDYLTKRQNKDGGWDAAGSGKNSDLAITCNAWLALRAAHNAGIAVAGASVAQVELFVKKCALPKGGFTQYPKMRGGGGQLFYPTAAGLRILYGMGRGDTPEIEKGLELLLSRRLGQEYGGKISEWDYCGGFYAVMALLHENGPAWKKGYPKLRDQLLKIQNADGSWTIEYCLCCRAYATALAALMLQAPKRSLPLFQL
ncbi:MAG TPA: prenyltransferase/squalene oxidase repeat-containing protein [Planctomycetota bacterium]|nr:prenyltransferase/squalene oxidase repeat-containing protein [Planctomycetota bacterium]